MYGKILATETHEKRLRMIKKEGNTKKVYNTSVEATLEVIGDKQKPVTLFYLTFGKKRNNELKRILNQITQKVLTEQLRELEEAGVILRISYNQVPPKVEYELTDYGWTRKEILHLMCRWGDDHISKTYGDNAKVLDYPLAEEKRRAEQ